MQFTSVFGAGRDEPSVRAVQRFRKDLFVDACGWDLQVDAEGREIDAFDTDTAVHMALWVDGRLRSSFRATRTDRPYLAASVFPQLAVVAPYPHRADVWEISRFGVWAGDVPGLSRTTYALMFRFAEGVGASALVAVTDLGHERVLRGLGVRTRRFGPPQAIGATRDGRLLRAVAGEIPLTIQKPSVMSGLSASLETVEIYDAAQVLGPQRLSA